MNADSADPVATSAHHPAADDYQRHAEEVYGWALRIVGCHHDALDVAQDVFLLWQKQCRKETPRAPRAWLRRATTNRAIDLVRKQVRERALPKDRGTIEGPRAAAVQAGALEVGQPLGIALDELSEMQRLVLLAKVFDEMTFAAIADELQLAVPTIKTHYLRALKTLRTYWERIEKGFDQ